MSCIYYFLLERKKLFGQPNACLVTGRNGELLHDWKTI